MTKNKARERARRKQEASRAARRKPGMNRHGLSRRIPDPIQRAVRQRCHFACVVCGAMPYDYEHFDPEFKDARTHEAAGITLLCQRCHAAKGVGLSLDQIRAANAKPYCTDHDPVWTHRLGEQPITLLFAGNRIVGSDVGVSIRDHDVLRLKLSDQGRWLLSGSLKDARGRNTLSFRDDQVTAAKGSWDVTFVGPRMTVRAGRGEIVAEVEYRADSRTVEVVRLNMATEGAKLTAGADGLTINTEKVHDARISGITGGGIHVDADGALDIGVFRR